MFLTPTNKRLHGTYCTWWWSICTLKNGLANVGVLRNSTSSDQNVPEFERHIRTIKEQEQHMLHCHSSSPTWLVNEMVYDSVFWLIAFPDSSAISKTISSLKFFNGGNIDYKKHRCLEFGSYVKRHESNDNSILPWTIEPLDYVLLATIKEVATSFPMPSDVIKRVDELAIHGIQDLSLGEEF